MKRYIRNIVKTILLACISLRVSAYSSMHVYVCISQPDHMGIANADASDLVGFGPRLNTISVEDYLEGEAWSRAVAPEVDSGNRISTANYFARTILDYYPDDAQIGIVMYTPTEGDDFGKLLSVCSDIQKTSTIEGVLSDPSGIDDSSWNKFAENAYNFIVSELSINRTEMPLVTGSLLARDRQSEYYSASEYRFIGKRLAEQMLTAKGIPVWEQNGNNYARDGFNYWIEGESLLRKKQYGAGFSTKRSKGASGGKLVVSDVHNPEVPYSRTEDLGKMDFYAPAGTYYLYALVNCKDTSSDSFWIKYDNAEFQKIDDLNTEGNSAWIRLMTMSLKNGGQHLLYIGGCEPGAAIDKLCISSNPNTPVGSGYGKGYQSMQAYGDYKTYTQYTSEGNWNNITY
ncbi:MAG: hypothetical protein MJY79_02100 [Bacteroidaceae bacterium]|nr:hypothetical protein [Bacteroidaceae bacterium]